MQPQTEGWGCLPLYLPHLEQKWRWSIIVYPVHLPQHLLCMTVAWPILQFLKSWPLIVQNKNKNKKVKKHLGNTQHWLPQGRISGIKRWCECKTNGNQVLEKTILNCVLHFEKLWKESQIKELQNGFEVPCSDSKCFNSTRYKLAGHNVTKELNSLM